MEQCGERTDEPLARRREPYRSGRRRALLALALAWLAAVCVPAAAEEWSYRVRPGDTLWDLSREYLRPGVPWQRLQTHNAVADPYRLAPGSALRVPLSWLLIRPARAKVVAVHGTPTVQRPGDTGTETVAAGMELGLGAVLRTPADANLTLEFADGSRLQLLGDSELHLDRLSLYGKGGMVDTRLRLQRGRIQNQVNRSRDGGASFIVDTPSATSSVRGTRFRVGAEADRSLTEVLEGTVDVRGRGRNARLQAGYGTIVGDNGGRPIRAMPLLPAPALARLPQRPVAPGTLLGWPAVDGADGYRVQIGTRPEFGELLLDTTLPIPQVELPRLPEGRYHLRVSAVDAQGLVGAEAVAALDLEIPPAPPYAIAPEQDGVAHAARPEFRWSRSEEAAAYRFQLADTADFAAPLHSLRTRETRYHLPQALAPGTYWWRVASDRTDGREGPFGDPIRFALRPAPEEIAMDPAPAGAEAPGRAVTFRWQSGGEGLRYRFQMSRSPDFRRLPVDTVVDQPQITLPRLGAGTWYLRAQTVDAQGREGPYPPTQSVRIPCRLCQAVVGGGALLILLAL